MPASWVQTSVHHTHIPAVDWRWAGIWKMRRGILPFETDDDWEAAAQEAARRQRQASAAIAADAGNTPLPLQEQSPQTSLTLPVAGVAGAEASLIASVSARGMAGSSGRGELTLTPTAVPLTIVPTIYPALHGDTVTVEDSVSINLGSAEFREFKDVIERLCVSIERSNQTSREVGDKLIVELQAGLKIIAGPKPS